MAVIVVDSAQGNSVFEIEMIHWIKRMYPHIDVVVRPFFYLLGVRFPALSL